MPDVGGYMNQPQANYLMEVHAFLQNRAQKVYEQMFPHPKDREEFMAVFNPDPAADATVNFDSDPRFQNYKFTDEEGLEQFGFWTSRCKDLHVAVAGEDDDIQKDEIFTYVERNRRKKDNDDAHQARQDNKNFSQARKGRQSFLKTMRLSYDNPCQLVC